MSDLLDLKDPEPSHSVILHRHLTALKDAVEEPWRGTIPGAARSSVDPWTFSILLSSLGKESVGKGNTVE